MDSLIKKEYVIPANDFSVAGEASSNVRKLLNQLGVDPPIVKRTSIAMYEAEINAVIHGNGGKALVEIYGDKIVILIYDEGPGIEDIELAMQEGVNPSYVSRVARLAFLAPTVVEAILAGRLRAGLGSMTLLKPDAIPDDWSEQARRFLIG